MLPRLDVAGYAEGVWKLRKASELGGLTIFCHPYWGTPVSLDVDGIDQTFADREFDAVEAISNVDPSSFMQNKLLSLQDPSQTLPLVGVSDSHNWGPAMKSEHFTLLMAESLSREAVFSAIRGGRSIACRKTDSLILTGPFDIACFAQFYIERIHPIRRRITALQGSLALSALRGGSFSQVITDQLDAELDLLDNSLWA